MSIAATNWAMEQKTDGPSAQSVLFIIADRASEFGVCRHADPDTIAEKSRQSRATVFRRLEELERVGVVSRFTRHLDDGRREYEVRLSMNRHVNYKVDKFRVIKLYDMADERCEGDPISILPFEGGEAQDVEGGSQSETHPESQIETHPVAPVRPTESQSCDPQKSPFKNPSKEDSPLTPQTGGVGQSSGNVPAGETKAWPHEASWQRAEVAWADPILHQGTCRNLWETFSDVERERFIRVVRGYLSWRMQQPKPPNRCNLQKLMREMDAWHGFEKLAGPDPALRTFVVEHSQEHRALQVIARIGRWTDPLIQFDVQQAQRGLWRGRPLKPDEIAMATFADIPVEQWQSLVRGTKEFYAWNDRLFDWTGARRDEPRVPCPFPPRKDGALSGSTDPPKESSAA